MATGGVTLNELQAKGAQPGLTAEQLQAQGAQPATPPPGPVMPPTPPLGQKLDTAAGGALDLMQRPGMAGMALASGRGGKAAWNAFVHSEPATAYQSDTARATMHLMGATPQEYEAMPGWRRAANEFAMQMIVDPTTYAGGTGLERRLVEGLGVRALPALMSVGPALARKYPQIAPQIQKAVQFLTHVHDATTPGGKDWAAAARVQAEKHGSAGARTMERVTGAAMAQKATREAFPAVMEQLTKGALRGLKPSEAELVYKAVHLGKIERLPPKLRTAATMLQRVDRSIPWVMGNQDLRDHLIKLGYVPFKELAPFDHRAPRNLMSMNEFRENHVPLANEILTDEQKAAAEASLRKRIGGRKGVVDVRNKFLTPRKDFKNVAFDDQLQRDTFLKSFHAAGDTIASSDLRNDLRGFFPHKAPKIDPQTSLFPEWMSAAEREAADRQMPNVPQEIQKLFTEKAGQEPTPVGEILRSLLGAGAYGKASLFYNPLPHQRNIATLLAAANPLAFPGAIADYVKSGFGLAKPSTEARVFSKAMRAGATTGPHLEETSLGKQLKNLGTTISTKAPLKGAGVGAVLGGLGNIYNTSGRMLWGWDKAAKSALFRRELSYYGGDAQRAAAAVQRKLVNYSMPSDLQRSLRNVMPFATWATGMPLALAESALTHPENTLALMRATSGRIGGAPFTEPQRGPLPAGEYQRTTPISKANQLTIDPMGYLINELGATPRFGLGMAAERLVGRPQSMVKVGPFKFPQAVIEDALSRTPIMSEALEFGGASPYGDTGQQSMWQAITGEHPSRAGQHMKRITKTHLPLGLKTEKAERTYYY